MTLPLIAVGSSTLSPSSVSVSLSPPGLGILWGGAACASPPTVSFCKVRLRTFPAFSAVRQRSGSSSQTYVQYTVLLSRIVPCGTLPSSLGRGASKLLQNFSEVPSTLLAYGNLQYAPARLVIGWSRQKAPPIVKV